MPSNGGDADQREMEVPLTSGSRSKRRWFERERALLVNFVVMSTAFSINHGCVTALLAVASTDLGKHLGSVSSGVLYVFYTLSALTFASMVVKKLGSKWSLAGGLWLYCFYVASFLVAHKAKSTRWYAAVTGSTIGGCAAGWLWTAQGAYFSRTASLHARASGRSIEQSTGWLGGLFATFYVGFEVAMKNLSSLLRHWGGDNFVFTVFLICAVTSAFAMSWAHTLPSKEEECEVRLARAEADGGEGAAEAATELDAARSESAADKKESVLHKIMLAGRLLATNRKMQLLTPMNMAFGFTSAFMNQYVNGTPAKAAVGASNIGYLAAITPGVATLLSFPYAWVTDRAGKGPMMVFGALNYTVMAVTVAILSQTQLTDLGWGIVYLYIIGGSGRAVFESTNKATFADFFPDDKEGAFANVIVQSGGASALAFFVIPYMTKLQVTTITAATGGIAMFCLVAAFRIYKSEQFGGTFAGSSIADSRHAGDLEGEAGYQSATGGAVYKPTAPEDA